jgi:integrase
MMNDVMLVYALIKSFWFLKNIGGTSMILIKEYIEGNEFFYESQVIDDRKIIATNSLHYSSVKKEYNKKIYIMLYTPEMRPISETFGFLNFYLEKQPITTKTKDLTALKLLYVYEDILSKRLVDFTAADVESFKLFISGNLGKGLNYNFDLITKRSNATINSYLATCRKYLSYLGQKNDYLTYKTKIRNYTHADSENQFATEKYSSNEGIGKKVNEVPRYISLDELRMIIKEIRQNYGLMEEIIVRLMFENGLRLGEVLGLTFDDILMEKLEFPIGSGNFQIVPVAYIRNRVSDRFYQKAKRLMQVNDRNEYKSSQYNTKDYGYNQIIIKKDLFNLINDYIDEIHLDARERKASNYYNYSIADRVRKPKRFEEDNFYIFINSLGKPLSQTLWNVTIRKIFKAVNIAVDRDVKQHNLNHRFRHGFAVYNVKRGVKQLELMTMMRHSSLQSVYKYYRPTLSDAIEMKTKFVEDLYTELPELRRED